MNVILDLDKDYLDKFQALADQDRRSRKNFMESVLINYLNGNPPTMERNDVPRENNTEMTLNKIKAMCPKDLTGLARTNWIFEKRKEHGV